MISNIVSFIHEDRIVEIKNPDPNETLLNYIRIKLKKTGTKEGCARRWLWCMYSCIRGIKR